MNKLNFHPFPIIITERLSLRQLKEEDITSIFNLRSNPTINKYLDRAPMLTMEEATAFITKINKGIQNNQWIYWAITLKDTDKLMGTICLWNFSKEYTIADIGYELHPDFQGKGFMSEAIKTIIQYASEELPLEVIEAYTHRENKNSSNLLLKNNFGLNSKRVDEDNEYHIVFERFLK